MHRTLIALKALLAAVFLVSGAAKLLGFPSDANDIFLWLSLSQRLVPLTGALEVLGAIGLLFPRTVVLAATGLTAVMVGAVLSHAVLLGTSAAFPATLLLMLAALIALQLQRQRVSAPS